METVEFKCQLCGLCNKDSQPYTCKINGDDIDIFPYDDDDEIVDKSIHRHYAGCLELNEPIVVDSDPDHSLDFLQSAVDCYAEQIGLDEDLVSWEVLKIGGKFQDCIAYDGYYIGRTFAECVKNLDKAVAGEEYGKSLDYWE